MFLLVHSTCTARGAALQTLEALMSGAFSTFLGTIQAFLGLPGQCSSLGSFGDRGVGLAARTDQEVR